MIARCLGCDGGGIGAIALARLVAEIIPNERLAVLSSQLLSRTQPALVDLYIGLAAGGVAAYVTVRTKALHAIPGAAVAVALVPPLATTGVLLHQDDPSLALNALLLFGTNLAAIVLAAALVFLASGFHPNPLAEGVGRRWERRLGLAAAMLAVVVVIAIPLGARTAALIREASLEADVSADVQSWAGS